MPRMSRSVLYRRIAVVAIAPVLSMTFAQGAATADAGTAAPKFQMPFPCEQKWAGQTRTDHSPAEAVDFNRANDQGDRVEAALGGTVSRVENEGDTSYGRWIEVDHGDGWTTRYAHLSKQTVKEGEKVKQGQKIGTVGSTGGSSGPHLHFEELSGGSPVKISFNGKQIKYWGEKDYKSKNC